MPAKKIGWNIPRFERPCTSFRARKSLYDFQVSLRTKRSSPKRGTRMWGVTNRKRIAPPPLLTRMILSGHRSCCALSKHMARSTKVVSSHSSDRHWVSGLSQRGPTGSQWPRSGEPPSENVLNWRASWFPERTHKTALLAITHRWAPIFSSHQLVSFFTYITLTCFEPRSHMTDGALTAN